MCFPQRLLLLLLLLLSLLLPSGYPWIDAAMRQLREWGWMHHLARHSVACFLTRGDLYISWEEGKEVFEELLIDAVSTCKRGGHSCVAQLYSTRDWGEDPVASGLCLLVVICMCDQQHRSCTPVA